MFQRVADFGFALQWLRAGAKVARDGWNGKGMYLYLVPEGRYAPTTAAGRKIAEKHPDGKVPYGAYIAMKTAQENVVPWLASQTDILANDWVVLNDNTPAPTYTPDPPNKTANTKAAEPFSNASLQAVMNSFEREMAALKTRVEALESEVHPNVNSPFHPTLWQKSALAALRGEAYPAWLFGHRRTPTQPPVRPTDNPAFPTGHPQSTPNDWIH